MVIAFKDNMGCIVAMYPISFISMETDDEGKPVDIVLKSKRIEILDDIAEKYGLLGYNSQEVMDFKNLTKLETEENAYVPTPTGLYEALYGRLQEFIVLPFYKESGEPEYIDW